MNSSWTVQRFFNNNMCLESKQPCFLRSRIFCYLARTSFWIVQRFFQLIFAWNLNSQFFEGQNLLPPGKDKLLNCKAIFRLIFVWNLSSHVFWRAEFSATWQGQAFPWGPIFRRYRGVPWPPNGSLNVSGSCPTKFRCLNYINIDMYIYITNGSLNFRLNSRLWVMTFHGYVLK